MKVIERMFSPSRELTKSSLGSAGGHPQDYSAAWYLYLECGHCKVVTPSNSAFPNGESIKKTYCERCDHPRPKKPLSDLKILAEYIIKNDL